MKQKKNLGKKIAVGVGLGIVAGAATYLLTGKRGVENRKKVKEFAKKAEEEIIKEAKKLKEITVDQYEALIKAVAEKYKNLDSEEFKKMALNLKKKLVKAIKKK